jgi:hypothetical protein
MNRYTFAGLCVLLAAGLLFNGIDVGWGWLLLFAFFALP